MTFQAYLDTIKAKTGKGPDDFKKLAAQKGLTKYPEVMAWLKSEYGLGHGHANAMAQLLVNADKLKTPPNIALDAHFTGDKARWRKPYDALAAKVGKFGDDVTFGANQSYINVMKDGRKFAIIQLTALRMDIGIKLKGVEHNDRFQPAGSWNAMVTHRVKIADPKEIDAEVVRWLKKAYEAA